MIRFFILFSLVIISCQKNTYTVNLQEGDILFIGESDGNLSKAITEVTQTEKGTNYSHIGFLEKKNGKFWLLHAAPENGSERISLDEYLKNERVNSKVIDVYRIKPEYKVDFQNAIETAKSLLGKPYNFTYSLSDSAYYCSDFVYLAFEKDSVFEMNPMTFKNPGEENFHSGWIQYYEKLGRPIPEGEMGCNPNGMAASEKLIKVGSL
jgi:uncharacterized protein YycO